MGHVEKSLTAAPMCVLMLLGDIDLWGIFPWKEPGMDFVDNAFLFPNRLCVAQVLVCQALWKASFEQGLHAEQQGGGSCHIVHFHIGAIATRWQGETCWPRHGCLSWKTSNGKKQLATN